MKLILSILVLILIIQYALCGMTEKQMKAAMKLVRNTCQTKTKVSNDDIDAQHHGDFSVGQCYILCIMNTYKLMTKTGDFDWEAGIKAIQANAPPEIAEYACKSLEKCKDSMKTTDDLCIGSAEIAKCIYDDNPQGYFLP